jgi:hypothetical protein
LRRFHEGLPCPLFLFWREAIEEANNACFIVRDNNGQALGYFYFEEEPGRRSGGEAADPSMDVGFTRLGLGHWHPSQLTENDASEPEPEQLELPFDR